MDTKISINVRDLNYRKVAIIDDYESFIWTERYSEAGEFELRLLPSAKVLEYLQPLYYLELSDSMYTMRIEDIEIETDAETGDKLVYKGRSLESILEDRSIYKEIDFNTDTPIPEAIKKILTQTIIDPELLERKIDNFIYEETTDPFIVGLKIKGQYNHTSVYQAITDILAVNNIGFRIWRDRKTNQFVFKLYYSVDRTWNQKSNPYVVFSPEYDNLLSLKYIQSSKTTKTVAIVAQSTDALAQVTLVASDYGVGAGLGRRELFVDGSNINKEETSDNSSEIVGPDAELSYEEKIEQKGREELAKNSVLETFQGEIDAVTNYVYGKDFFIGDIIQLNKAVYGIKGEVRITETVRTYDENGYNVSPTFVSIYRDLYVAGAKLRLSGIYTNGRKFDLTFATYEDMKDWLDAKREDITNLTAEAPKNSLTNIDDFFSNMPNLTVLNVPLFRTNMVTSMKRVFKNTPNIETLDLSNWETDLVEHFDEMFYGFNASLPPIISGFKTTKAYTFDSMFEGYKLDSINLSGFVTRRAISMNSMFKDAVELTTVDLDTFTFNNTIKWNTYTSSSLYIDVDTLVNSETDKSIVLEAIPNAVYTISTPSYSTNKTVGYSTEMPSEGLTITNVQSTVGTDITFTTNVDTTYIIVQLLAVDNTTYLWEDLMNALSISVRLPDTDIDDIVAGCVKMGESYAHTDADAVLLNTSLNKPEDVIFVRKPTIFRITGTYTDDSVFDEGFNSESDMDGWLDANKTLFKTIIISSTDAVLTTMRDKFRDCTELISLDMSALDVSKVADFSSVCEGCVKLTTLNTDNWITTSMTYIDKFVKDCESIVSIDWSHWNTDKLATMDSVFHNCLKIRNINIPFNTKSVYDFSWLMYNCPELLEIDLSTFDFLHSNYVVDNLFVKCTKVTKSYAKNQASVDILNALDNPPNVNFVVKI